MALSPAVVAALGRCPRLWGWGLNGDPVSEAGARVPAAGLVRRAMLSHMADDVLAGALNHVRLPAFRVLVHGGLQAATEDAEGGQAALRGAVPPSATAALRSTPACRAISSAREVRARARGARVVACGVVVRRESICAGQRVTCHWHVRRRLRVGVAVLRRLDRLGVQ